MVYIFVRSSVSELKVMQASLQVPEALADVDLLKFMLFMIFIYEHFRVPR